MIHTRFRHSLLKLTAILLLAFQCLTAWADEPVLNEPELSKPELNKPELNKPQLNEQVLHEVEGRPMAPDFKLRDIDGKLHALADYRGGVVVLNFWATWCPPCRFEMPSMERGQNLTAADGVVFLGVNVGEDADTIFTFTADYPVTFPLLMDKDSRVIQQYPVVGLPTTYVIDPQGRMVYQAIGTRDWDHEAILKQLKSLKP